MCTDGQSSKQLVRQSTQRAVKTEVWMIIKDDVKNRFCVCMYASEV